MPKPDDNLMCLVDMMNAAPRCTAKAKRTGQRCKGPAVRGWDVWRFHGARGGAPCGEKHGNYRHGGRTKESETISNLAILIRHTLP